MLPLFLSPLALLGLLAVPVLVGIYLFRNRFRRQVVSSLMLWVDTREARDGGQKLRRLQTPLLFLLELLAILLLALAAAEPQFRMATSSRPLIVILDDSYSMLAGGEKSPRKLAEAALLEQLERQPPYSIRFILAGEQARLLGETARSAREVAPMLKGWKCKSPQAKIGEALALAGELGGELSLLLVLTDHKPAQEKEFAEKGRVRWWSFGTAQPNIAFVNASRTYREGLDRLMVEVANLSNESAQTDLVIAPLEGGQALRRGTLNLAKNDVQRLILQLPPGTSALSATLTGGALGIDSNLTLLNIEDRPVKVDARIRDARLREPILKALNAARAVRMVAETPQLIFTDRESPADTEDAWLVSLIAEKEAVSYGGPFVLDRTHSLTDGLSLKSTIWGAGKSAKLDGAPLIMAGNIVLVADSELPTTKGGTRHHLRIRIRPDLSTVQDSPDWPILFANILSWRAAAMPGLTRNNIRLGERVTLYLDEYREKALLTEPGKPTIDVPIKGRQVVVNGEEIGIRTLKVPDKEGDKEFRFAVNALNRDESDLRGCAEGKLGDWLDDTTLRLEYRGVAWILILVMLTIGVGHLVAMAYFRSRSPGA
jgi:hypothetical protein